jgi:DNA-directed RNA polymerase specialized sigma24 family protein
VDTEGIVQEAFTRMWLRSQERMPALTGENASLRSAIVTAANLARNTARKHRREQLLPPEDIPVGIDPPVAPPLPDPLLRRIIRKCIDALAGPLRRAMRANLDRNHRPKPEQAQLAGMTVNTFNQNLVRARRGVDDCLRRNGVDEHEDLR